MASKILNIEIGDSLVKVCCSASKKKTCNVTDSFMFPAPVESVNDGAINDPERLADRLREELDSHELRGIKGAVFTIASAKIASREIKLPVMKDKQIAETVKTNAADYFPVDITKYHVTHTLLERVKGADGFCRVLVMAVPLSLLEGYFKLAELAKLDIIAIDSCGNSHYQLIRRLKTREVTMFVDVDCTASFISFVQGDNLLLQRTLAFGGGDLVASYMQSNGIGEGGYVKALSAVSVNSPDYVGEDAIGVSVIDEELSRLAHSMVRSVDYFNSFRWEASAAQIVLMGSCAHVSGLKERVAEATDLPTFYFEELKDANTLASGADVGVYIGCIGSNIAPVDFMPEFLRRRRKITKSEVEESLVKGIVACAVLVAGAVALCVLTALNYKSDLNNLHRVQQEIERLGAAEEVYLTYTAYQQGEQALLHVQTLASNPNSQLRAFFEELESKMPSGILVLTALCTTDGVTMSITVPSLEESAVTISQFRTFESLSQMEVSSVAIQRDEAGFETASFTISCSYGKNPYLNDINPYAEIIGLETGDSSSAETEVLE